MPMALFAAPALRRRRSKLPSPLLTVLLVAATAAAVAARPISDGVVDGGSSASATALLRMFGGEPAAECEQTYGFFPCSTSALGNAFLIAVFGYLMYKSATFLSAGSEELLEIMGPGIIGGLLLPILGALPDAMLILFSGLSGSKDTAQQQVLIGMGLLAGSIVMLITALWGSCVVVGKCDISENLQTAVDSTDTKGFSLTGSGVTTDEETSHAAKIMAVSVAPFVIVQLPKILHDPPAQRIAVLISLIVAVLLLFSYCIYQIYQPWIQKKRMEFARLKFAVSGLLQGLQRKDSTFQRLVKEDGAPDEHIIRSLFKKIDVDESGDVSKAELRALLVGLVGSSEISVDEVDDIVNRLMTEFDTSGNEKIDEDEFFSGLTKWINDSGMASRQDGQLDKFYKEAQAEKNKYGNGTSSSEPADEQAAPRSNWLLVKAVLLLLLGTVMAAVFADPLVDSVHNFSVATSIPSFFISFILMPFVTNASEAVSSIIFASKKKITTASLTFSEIYGGVTMNNTMCLAVFLALVYVRHLKWDFSSEVLVILIVCIAMGSFTSFRTTFPLWTSLVAFALYPLTLVIIYILDFIFGWS